MEIISKTDLVFEKEIYKRNGIVEIYTAHLYSRPNETICVKKIFADSITDASNKYNECISMATLTHPNIIRLRSCILSGEQKSIDSVLIIMEYFPEGDLEAFIQKAKKSGGWSEEALLNYANQLISAFAYMQSRNVSHRDIKPQNIFVSGGGTVLKIGDLGESTKGDRELLTIRGTPLYLSPKVRAGYLKMVAGEVANVAHNPFKSDVYSLGMVFLYMVTYQTPSGLANLSTLKDALNQKFAMIDRNYTRIDILIRKMLQVEEELRPDFIELEKFFHEIASQTEILRCGKCKSVLNMMQFREFNNSMFCLTCYEAVIGLQTYCSYCKSYYRQEELLNYDHNFCCKSCIMRIDIFVEGRLICKICTMRLNAVLECECEISRCHICKGAAHPHISCAQAMGNADYGYIFSVDYLCDCEEIVPKFENKPYFYCASCQFSYCIVCCKVTSEIHIPCYILFLRGNQIYS